MRIEQFDPKTDDRQLRACHQIAVSGQVEDDPAVPAVSYGMFRGWWAFGLIDEPKETWLATGDDGQAVGCYLLDLPVRENKNTGFFYPVVALTARRRGIGTALVAHAVERAELAGRTLLISDARIGAPGPAFAAAVGAKPGMTEARRILDAGPELFARLPALRAEAEPHTAGYNLRYWSGPAPADLVGQICSLEDAMADAPHEDWYEPEKWDADRVRAADERLKAQGVRQYSIAAIHAASGQMAALTQLVVDPAVDGWAFQELTAVTRPHRGHRLGMLIKVAMLAQVSDLEPQVRQIMTFNSVDNAHMIAVNAGLGHRETDHFRGYELDLAAASTAAAAHGRDQ